MKEQPASWAKSGNPQSNNEKLPEKPLFEVTLMRHAESTYEDIGHDLTPEGIEQAKAAGARLRDSRKLSDSDVFLFHSPTPRAKGTLDFAAEAAGLSDIEKHAVSQLRTSDVYDEETFSNSIEVLADEKGITRREAGALHHYTDPMHEEGIVLEKHSQKQERLYRTFEYLARWFDHHPSENPNAPQIIAVSHFEIITHLINDVFDITTFETYREPGFTDAVDVKAFPYADGILRLVVSYKGRTKEVLFDRKSRSIKHIEA